MTYLITLEQKKILLDALDALNEIEPVPDRVFITDCDFLRQDLETFINKNIVTQ
mgnify:CR=1 FL=1